MAAYRKYAAFIGIRKPYLILFWDTVRKKLFTNASYLGCQ